MRSMLPKAQADVLILNFGDESLLTNKEYFNFLINLFDEKRGIIEGIFLCGCYKTHRILYKNKP